MRPSLAAPLASFCLACAPPLVPPAPVPYSLPASFSWVAGCWSIASPAHIVGAGIADLVLVQLDTAVQFNSPPHVRLSAAAIAGFPRWNNRPFPLFWYPVEGDSIDVGFQSLSGLFWRLTSHGDSLRGQLYGFYDLGPSEGVVGQASGHRISCP